MKNILSVSDSYEGTLLDVKRSTASIRGFGMDPFIAVSEYVHSDGSSDSADIGDTLDFCFDGNTPDAVFVGFIKDPKNASVIASKLAGYDPAIVVSDPSIISEQGEVWMTEETYNVISTSIFDMSSHIIINHFEAELLSGFECKTRFDFERAVRKLHNCFRAAVYIKGCSLTGNKGVFCDGSVLEWIDDDRSKADPALSFGNALCCELALGSEGARAVTNAIYFTVNGHRISEAMEVPQVAPSLISPAKSLRDIARSIDTLAVSAATAKKGTVSELKTPSQNTDNSLSELADIRKRLENLKKSSM